MYGMYSIVLLNAHDTIEVHMYVHIHDSIMHDTTYMPRDNTC